MKSLDEIDSSKLIKTLPYAIDTSGTYKVAGSLSSSSSGITITASNVVLDLNGYTLRGTGPGSTNGVYISASCKNVRVKNGQLYAWGENGLRCDAPDDCDDDGLDASNCTGNGFLVKGATLQRCTASNNGLAGISASPSPNCPIRCSDGSCRSNGGNGISIVCSSAGTCTADVSNMQCESNGTSGVGSGIDVVADAATLRYLFGLRGSACCSNASSGLSVHSNVCASFTLTPYDCRFSNNVGSGVDVVDGSGGGAGGSLAVDVSSSECNGNGGDGLSVVRSVASAAPLSVTVRGTFCDGNSGYGMKTATLTVSGTPGGTAFADSSASRNGLGGGKVTFNQFSVTRCVASQNGSLGVLANGLDVDCDGTADFADCVATGNSGAGISMHCRAATCRSITANGNLADGIVLSCDNASVRDATCDSNGGNGLVRKGSWDLATNKGRIDMEECRVGSNGGNGVQIDSSPVSLYCVRLVCTDNAGNGLLRKGWDGTIKGNSCLVDSRSWSNAAAGIQIEGGDMSADLESVSAHGNGGTGADLGAKKDFKGHVTLMKFDGSENEEGGLRVGSSGGGVIKDCATDNNTSDGMALSGSYFTVTDNRATSNTASGIRVLSGTGSRISGNAVSGNSDGIFLASSGNSLYENSGSGNAGAVIAGSVLTNDIAPSSTAATATSPVGNIEF
jgi:parallel beta-helix repeat protein